MEIMNNVGDQAIQPAGYTPIADPNKKKKKIVTIVIVSLVSVIILTGVVLFMSLVYKKGISDTEAGDDNFAGYDDDYGQDETGGEEEDLPENQEIFFLGKYGVSDEDMAYVQTKIFEVLDEYYGEGEYSAVYYSIDDVKVADSGDQINFTVYTNWADQEIDVTIKLVNGEVDTVKIY